MSFVNFGMSFILKGLHNPKLAKRLAKKPLLDGVFQIHIDNRQFNFIVKHDVVHTVSFSDLYDARGSLENKFVIEMLFNSSFPSCELHAQSEQEKEAVHRILQTIVSKNNITLEDKLGDLSLLVILISNIEKKSVHKQATVKKKGKIMASKRVLNTWRHCLIIFYDENFTQDFPSYHILIHHKVTIHQRKKKSLQIVGTYKNLWIAFKTQEERDSWYTALKETQLPVPAQEYRIQTEAPAFEAFVAYAPEQRARKYIPAALPGISRAGPSPD